MLSHFFSDQLIQWQHQYGRKGLPWQGHQSPYLTWVSEIMLQQTQVDNAKPYFIRFIKHYPNVQTLAEANPEDVMRDWAGLGYYARARNLHLSAKIIHQQHNNQFPNSIEELIKLPGIGRSTAGAILAFGFKKRGVILDGNVKRVLSRFFGIFNNPHYQRGNHFYWQVSHLVTPTIDCDVYTQAIMDIGATVCHVKTPQCQICPLQSKCYAEHYHCQHHLPIKKLKKKPKTLKKLFILPVKSGKVGLTRQHTSNIWKGLWCPIIIDTTTSVFDFSHIHYRHIIKDLKHVFTHQTWKIDCILVYPPNDLHNQIDAWYDIHQLDQIGLPKPMQTIKEMIQYEKNLLHETAETT